MTRKHLPLLLGLCLAVLTSSACSGPALMYDRPNSEFDYPNSNVIPKTARITDKLNKISLSNTVGDVDMERKLVMKILKDHGGDILINPRYTWKSRIYPFFLTIYDTTLEIEGVVATMSVGNQQRPETPSTYR